MKFSLASTCFVLKLTGSGTGISAQRWLVAFCVVVQT